MISTDSVQHLIGANAYDPDGNKIGTIGQIYLDNDSGAPEWGTVKTGLFGTRESFVPLRNAELSGDGIGLAYDKELITDAPGIEADQEVSAEEEMELYEYYDLLPDEDSTTDYDRRTTGHDTSGPMTDEAMTRSEERVRVGKESRQTGRARLRKYVVTEQQRIDVPVTHEEVRVEREPITEENRDRAMAGPEISDEEHEIVLTEERATIQKETVPVERVRLDKDQVTEDESVDVDVRQERIDTDVDEGADTRARSRRTGRGR